MKASVVKVLALVTLLGSAGGHAQTPPYVPYTQISTWVATSPDDAGKNLLTLGYGNILMKSSLGWGGAIYDYAVEGSGTLVNQSGTGTLWQSMVNIIYPDGTSYVNPTEAGDRWNRGSAVLQSTNSGGNVQSTKSAPFQFANEAPAPTEVDLGATAPTSTNVAVQFNGMTIGKQVTLGFNGDNNVAQYVAKVYASTNVPHISANLPVLYLPGNFSFFTAYDAGTGVWSYQPLAYQYPPRDLVSPAYESASNCGGIIAENTTRTFGVALYACKPGVRGLRGTRHLAFLNASQYGSSDPRSTDTTALMAQIATNDYFYLPSGESSFTTYIVGCKGTSTTYAGVACVNSMANLYAHGY